MKSTHRAKADFLRELRILTDQLYALGDFTCSDPARVLLENKIEGFIEAGLLIEVASRNEMQHVIDNCHINAFSETRSERRDRLASGTETLGGTDDQDITPDYDSYDSPAIDRIKNRQLR